MRKSIVLLAALLLLGAAAHGQQGSLPSDFHRLTIESSHQQFDATRNAAGMGLYQPVSGSNTSLEGFYSSGDYHLAQQGASDRGFRFSTLRYDSFSDKLFMKGSFFYRLDGEKDRKWSDVMDPWFSIPYIYGSAVAKEYETHDCGLTFDLYTAPLWDWLSFGVRTTYEVSDISGKRDPRPRTGYLDWQAVPSLLASFGPHHVGLDFGYGHTKEKLTNLTTIQSYPNLYYYKMAGLDHVDGAIAAYSGFKRQFSGGRWLGDLSYSLTRGPWRILASGGLEYKRLDANGDKKQSPGSWNVLTWNTVVDVEWTRPRALHKLHVTGSLIDGGADEYLQELSSVKDPETGITTETWVTLYEYTNRYILGKQDAEAVYTLYGGCRDGQDYRWSATLGAAYSAFAKNEYLPRSEFDASGLTANLGGSLLLLDRQGHRIELAARGSYRISLNTKQRLFYDNLYTREVLVPDLDYYNCSWMSAGAELTWQFPLHLGKAGSANAYLRLSGNRLSASDNRSLSSATLAVGLFTF